MRNSNQSVYSTLVFFTKVGTNRLAVIAHIAVHLTHTTSIPWQHILKGVVILMILFMSLIQGNLTKLYLK